jgi:D-alanyl-D-alanine carboxypeptidase
MKRLLIGLICISIPFLALYGVASCFSPDKAVRTVSTPRQKDPVSLTQYVDNRGNGPAGTALSDLEKDLTRVVDRDIALSPNYEPDDLVPLIKNGIRAKHSSLQLRKIVVPHLKAMFDAAEAAGYKLMVFSAYRSYKTQQRLYAYWVNTLGKEEADRSSARPGHSEHQLGTTVDVTAVNLKGDVFDNFGKSPAGKWLAENAYKYGFVMSYPPDSEPITGYKYEPWHFRYLGMRIAKIIKEQDLIPPQYLRYLASKSDN